VGYQERIPVRPSGKDKAKFLDIPDNERGSVIARTHYRAARKPLWVTVTVLSADRANGPSTPVTCRVITPPPRWRDSGV
jgi:hypothetical protein